MKLGVRSVPDRAGKFKRNTIPVHVQGGYLQTGGLLGNLQLLGNSQAGNHRFNVVMHRSKMDGIALLEGGGDAVVNQRQLGN